MTCKRLECHCDRFLELRIMTEALLRGIILYLDVGRDTVVLYFPFPMGTIDGPSTRDG